MHNTNSFFILFTNCIPIKGETTSLIYDLQKGKQIKIPNLLFDVLEQSKSYNVNDLKNFFDNQYDDGIDSYFNLLLEKGLGFYTDSPHSFPLFNTEFYNNQKLEYCLIELSDENVSYIEILIHELNTLGVKYLQIRDIRMNPLDDFEKILSPISKHKGILAIEVFIKHYQEALVERATELALKMKHISKIILLSAPEDKSIKISPYSRKHHIFLLKYEYEAFVIEKLSKNTFTCNVRSFAESHHKNLGLNSKICITKEGEVKNHFMHSESFGSLYKESIHNILDRTDIKKQWKIPKFKVENCKSCIYRYCCSYASEIEIDKNKYYLKNKCNYDPQHDKWFS